jgi:hypothetical protein
VATILYQLVTDPDRKFVDALVQATQITSADKVAATLLTIAHVSNDIIGLLKFIICNEVQNTSKDILATSSLLSCIKLETANTLLRGNSIASKMLYLYATDAAKDYLRKVLVPPIRRLMASKQSLEVITHVFLFSNSELN